MREGQARRIYTRYGGQRDPSGEKAKTVRGLSK